MINNFTEKEIRNSILNKVQPTITHKGAKHWKCSIFLEGILISKVKVPNAHLRIMKEKKSQYIAESLRLTDEQFNRLIECSMKGTEYYRIQKQLGY